MRSTWLWTFLTLGFLAAVFGGWRWLDNATFQREFSRAEADLANGRTHAARKRLLELRERRPQSAEAAYQLGLCEEKLGHLESALKVWSGVTADSPLFVQTCVCRALTLMNLGRYAVAEELLAAAPRHTGRYAGHVRDEIETLLRIEGRTREVRKLIVEAWRGASNPSEVLNRLYMLEDAPFPVEYVTERLKRGDPNDDRVWLGHANLAIWSGRFPDAVRWLDACTKRRPDDQSIWLARLAVAMASSDADGARSALVHVKSDWFLPAEVLRIRAWLAASSGDDDRERQTLTAMTALEPGDAAAWARLAELAIKAGDRAEAETFAKKQAHASSLRERYDRLMLLDDRGRYADELARLAKELGRPIEARGWSLIQRGEAALDPLWPADSPVPGGQEHGGMLADLVDESPAGSTVARIEPAAPSTLPAFADLADPAGLHFMHDNGPMNTWIAPPATACGGVALLDYDGDGWLDVFAVQAGVFPPAASGAGDGDRMFHNRGDGTFEDVTKRTGIAAAPRGYGNGVAVGDYDNDGRPDLFVTRWRSYALYHNKGDGRFEDATYPAGLAGDRDWPTSAAFADLDGDGDLDLYVCHYIAYDPSDLRFCERPDSPGKHECLPRDFPSLPDHVFRNDHGRFIDVTSKAGFVDPDGRGLGVVAADLDDDNKIDLYVANDMSANYLFHNLGGFRFEETGELSGSSVSADGLLKSGMGIACGDLDGDGRLDLAVTNFFGESTTFYQNLGHGLFADHTAPIGLLAPSRPRLGFGIAFPDVNNDTWLDLISTNGHVSDSRPRIPWKMPLQLMIGGDGSRLVDVSNQLGEPFQRTHLGRGLAIGDLDNDGRLDVVILNQNEPLVYLHNTTTPAGHFIRFSLEGTSSNRDGVGARVTIRQGGRRQMSERMGGGSYQSASDPRLHFGLGASREVEAVEVRWPSGKVDRHGRLIGDREYRLREGGKPIPADRRVVTIK
jgi:enediyne biosynthesis protein E4